MLFTSPTPVGEVARSAGEGRPQGRVRVIEERPRATGAFFVPGRLVPCERVIRAALTTVVWLDEDRAYTCDRTTDMNHFLSSVLLAVSSNIDNLGVAFAYGVLPRRIRPGHNLLIALVSASGTLASMATGEWVNDYMSEWVANAIGAGILIAIGLFNVVQTLRRIPAAPLALKGPSRAPAMATQTTAREGLALAVSLTLNNLGTGVGAGISHVSIPLTTLLTLAASLAAVDIGYRLGRRATPGLSQRGLGVASGLLIVGLGILELFV